jgi:hypothetical protein
MFWRKPGILIPDLYLYSIIIQTNIDQNAVNFFQKITDFFGIIVFWNFEKFLTGPDSARPF